MAPILTEMRVPDVGPVPTNTSVRLMTIFTGWPEIWDILAASGSRYTPPCPFPPNPPPISMGMTFTLDTGSPRIFDAWSRTEKCPWLLHQMVT